jgi:hypothetical protein
MSVCVRQFSFVGRDHVKFEIYIITQLYCLIAECIGYYIVEQPHSSWFNIKVSHRQYVADTHKHSIMQYVCVYICALFQIPNLTSVVRVPSAITVEWKPKHKHPDSCALHNNFCAVTVSMVLLVT